MRAAGERFFGGKGKAEVIKVLVVFLLLRGWLDTSTGELLDSDGWSTYSACLECLYTLQTKFQW